MITKNVAQMQVGSMKSLRFSKVVRPGHGGKMGNSSGREDPVITDRLRAEDFVFTKVCNLFDFCVDRDVVSKCAFVNFIYNYFIIDFSLHRFPVMGFPTSQLVLLMTLSRAF